MSAVSEAFGRRLPSLLLLAAFVISQVGFILAVPAFRGIDEVDHAFRASSVAHGHWWAGNRLPDDGRGFLLPVDATVAAAAFEACDYLQYTGPDNCTPVTAPDASGEVEIASAAATYNPSWYSLTGTISRPFDGARSLLVMRIASLLLVDSIVLSALLLARSSRRPLPLSVGVLVAGTPVVAYSSTIAAPNGATYAAAILLWVSLIRLAEDEPASRGTFVGATLGASIMLLTHSTSILFVPLIALCAAPMLWPRRQLIWSASRRPTVATCAAVGVVATLCATWILLAGTNDPRAGEMPTESLGQMPLRTAVAGPFLWVLQSIATLTFRNEPAPTAAYALGFVAITCVVVVGVRGTSGRFRVSMALLAVLSATVPLALTWVAYNTQGAAWQGRYSLPLLSGIILIASAGLGAGKRAAVPWQALALLLAAMVGAHAVTVAAMVRSLRGPLDPVQWVFLVLGTVLALGSVTAASRLLAAPAAEREARLTEVTR